MSEAADANANEAALMRSVADRVNEEARYLSGWQVMQIRDALQAAAQSLGLVNPKGLPIAHRRDISSAEHSVKQAMKHVAPAKHLNPDAPRKDVG